MKKVIAIILILLSFAGLYDIVLILNGDFLPPYSVRPFGEVNTNTYIAYKTISVIVMLIVAYKILYPENDETKLSTRYD